jgi:hypothetical protein
MNLSLPRKPDNSTNGLPFVFVGDEAFALPKDLLKPFGLKLLTSERVIINYHLSRAWRIMENVFGIMTFIFKSSIPK